MRVSVVSPGFRASSLQLPTEDTPVSQVEETPSLKGPLVVLIVTTLNRGWGADS